MGNVFFGDAGDADITDITDFFDDFVMTPNMAFLHSETVIRSTFTVLRTKEMASLCLQ